MSDPDLQLHPAKISFLMSAYQDAACLQLFMEISTCERNKKPAQMTGYMYQTCLGGFVAIISIIIYNSRKYLLYYKHMFEATMIHSLTCPVSVL